MLRIPTIEILNINTYGAFHTWSHESSSTDAETRGLKTNTKCEESKYSAEEEEKIY